MFLQQGTNDVYLLSVISIPNQTLVLWGRFLGGVGGHPDLCSIQSVNDHLSQC